MTTDLYGREHFATEGLYHRLRQIRRALGDELIVKWAAEHGVDLRELERHAPVEMRQKLGKPRGIKKRDWKTYARASEVVITTSGEGKR